MNAYYTVFWDNSNGIDWDQSFDSPLQAYNFYIRLRAPYKDLVMTDRENGDRLLLSSHGDDNIDRYHLRYLFDLAK